MLLTFSSDDFVQKIKDRTKIHTIRADKHDRWKEGMKIHFWRGNPRNVKSHPYAFGEGVVEKIDTVKFLLPYRGQFPSVKLNGHLQCPSEIVQLAKDDGFDSVNDFFEWFLRSPTSGENIWQGKIIHWEQATLNFFQSETNSNQLKLL